MTLCSRSALSPERTNANPSVEEIAGLIWSWWMSWAICPLRNRPPNCFSSSLATATSEPASLSPPISPLPNGPRFLANQTQQDTLLFEELSGEVTITDPTHPLYGQTFPLLTIRVNRNKTHVTVLLPTGRRRSVPRLVTNLEHPAEESSHAPPLPVISVRTILPLAHLVQGLKQAKEESHAEQAASTIQPTEQCSTSSDDPLASASYEQPTATRSPGRRTHSARAKSGKGQGVCP
jgi:hypothetical protein